VEGWIKLYRKFEASKFGNNIEYIGLFPALLIMANHKEGFTKDGTKILPGQLMTSKLSLAKRFRLSEAKVRRMLEKLKIAEQIDVQSSDKNTIITILNWEKYQGSDGVNDDLPATCRRPTDDLPTTNKNAKNAKNEKNITSPLSFLFDPNHPIQEWLSVGRGVKQSQLDLLKAHSHHVLAEEVMKAYYWQLEKTARQAGKFLHVWMDNKKHNAFNPDNKTAQKAQADKEFYDMMISFGAEPQSKNGDGAA
jgi:hypothetical protein